MAKAKTKIEKLFDKRKSTYEKQTSTILASIDGVIDGIKLYASNEGLMGDDTYFEVLVSSIDPDTKFVFIVGAIMPEIGSTVSAIDGDPVVIEDANHQQLFAKTLQVNISDEIIELNDPDATCEYIKVATENMEKLQKSLAEIEAIFDPDDSDGIEDYNIPKFADFNSESPVLTDDDKEDDEVLRKILEGATNKSGLFN